MDVGTVSLAIAAVLPAVFAVIRSLGKLIQNYRSERIVEEQLALLSNNMDIRKKMQEIIRELQVSNDRRALVEAEEFITRAIEQVETEARKPIEEGLRQDNERGRMNYAVKLLKESTAQAPDSQARPEAP